MKARISYKYMIGIFAIILGFSVAVNAQKKDGSVQSGGNPKSKRLKMDKNKVDTATFAAGCFWCVEEQFKMLKGVISVTSGFTGGHVENPSYKDVTTGITGHAEACNIVYDPTKISYKELLQAFFVAHDPTQLNRQGEDIGTQYRSAIFYHNEEQKKEAQFYISRLDTEKAYQKKIVTEVSPFKKFYKAEDYHQNYYENNAKVPYCQLIIKPKVEKFKNAFAGKLK